MYPRCVSLCREQNSIINQDNPPNYTVINPGNTPIVKLYWGVRAEQGSTTTIVRLKCDGTRTETRFRLSPKRTSPFKSAGASVQSTAGSRGVRISGSNAGYTAF